MVTICGSGTRIKSVSRSSLPRARCGPLAALRRQKGQARSGDQQRPRWHGGDPALRTQVARAAGRELIQAIAGGKSRLVAAGSREPGRTQLVAAQRC